MRNIHNKGFTLVELLITLVIIVILGTIAIIAYLGYAQSARDTTRVGNLEQIESQLDLNKVREGYFPTPEKSSNITYDGKIIWIQGSLGPKVRDNIEFFSTDLDPKYDNPIDYDYSVTVDGRKYQLGTIYEDLQNF